MQLLGSLVFAMFMPLWVIFLAVFFYPVYLFGTSRNVGFVAYVWAAGVLFAVRVLCGIKHEVKGLERLPEGSYIIASKHQSAWDTAIFHVLLNRPVFILKKELTKLPFFGPYLGKMGMVAIDRSGQLAALKDMVVQVEGRLKQGRPVVIFPEGTRTKPGAKVKYHPGIAALYTHESIDAPIVPVALNSGIFWGRSSFMKKQGVVQIEFLPPLEKGLPRKVFMETLERQIEEASTRLLETRTA
ncbi:MAG: acyl-phosphate glycerol 3-phosphate acyltransferase [Rickettsiales bacterium]|jgi:1-acyl-sn-glycerol-3-phosphate acyltransferase|nr:acyl-phosphate glycerol 3-phosphate acyltransferase [Rickettsiales bacterium]